jgi:type IV fimbrial biogenesis protein FimT
MRADNATATMNCQRGFTIVELMIAIVIAGVLAAITVPNMSEFIKNNTRTTRVNTMVTALNYARSEAVSRNARVSLCKSSGPNFNNCDAIGTGDFASGWIVFVDGGLRGGITAPADVILRVFQPDMGGNATLIGSRNVTKNPISGISYESTGLGSDLDPPATDLVSANTIFRYCDDRGTAQARGIVISRTGSPSLNTDIAGLGFGCP